MFSRLSAVSLKVASMMAGKLKVGGQDSTLCTEPVFFDGMHTQVKFFVSFTLWVFQPTIENDGASSCHGYPQEHSDDIEIFFDTFNKALRDYLNEPEYIWDPFLHNDGP